MGIANREYPSRRQRWQQEDVSGAAAAIPDDWPDEALYDAPGGQRRFPIAEQVRRLPPGGRLLVQLVHVRPPLPPLAITRREP
jgi:hypothetical protein